MVIKFWDDHTERWHDEPVDFLRIPWHHVKTVESWSGGRGAGEAAAMRRWKIGMSLVGTRRCPRWIAIENGHL